MTETNVQQATRRAQEVWATLTQEQREAVIVLQESVGERLANMLVGPGNAKGRVPWHWATEEAAQKFSEQSRRR